MIDVLLVLKALITGPWFILLFTAERLARAAQPPAAMARLFRNVGLWGVSLFASLAIVWPLTAAGLNQAFWTRPVWMGEGGHGVLFFILDMMILDCWAYWLHRAYHHVPLMWRFHEIHHRDEFLDTTSALRFHFGEIILSASLRLAVIAVFAIPLTTVIFFEIVLLCVSIFHHSNVRLPNNLEKALSLLIVTPSIHWLHHHATSEDTNSNYAACLSCWDRLFFTTSKNKRVRDMDIGLENAEDKSFLVLLKMPFRRAVA
ncbi:MAG: sterol desaturase family protein [Hyphococcus sp.]